ncbi:hypothetical protein AAY473_035795 [Plecturocebus cupreus]
MGSSFSQAFSVLVQLSALIYTNKARVWPELLAWAVAQVCDSGWFSARQRFLKAVSSGAQGVSVFNLEEEIECIRTRQTEMFYVCSGSYRPTCGSSYRETPLCSTQKPSDGTQCLPAALPSLLSGTLQHWQAPEQLPPVSCWQMLPFEQDSPSCSVGTGGHVTNCWTVSTGKNIDSIACPVLLCPSSLSISSILHCPSISGKCQAQRPFGLCSCHSLLEELLPTTHVAYSLSFSAIFLSKRLTAGVPNCQATDQYQSSPVRKQGTQQERWGFTILARLQAGLELLISGDPPNSASQSAGITGVP